MQALLIDDDRIDRERIRRLARSIDTGIEIVEATNVPDALDLLETQEFDCLLVDQRIPGICGIELVAGLRSPAYGIDLPIIMVSHDDTPEVERRARQAGVDLYVTKGSLTAESFAALFRLPVPPAGVIGPSGVPARTAREPPPP
jgi:CheY-like chemotaxis protein